MRLPPGVESLPFLTRSRIDADATSSEIDELVSAQQDGLYELDEDMLVALKPDLILTQEQCDVCAVDAETVREAAGRLPVSPRVESFNPTDLEGRVRDVPASWRPPGRACEKSESMVAGFKLTAGEIGRLRRAAGDGGPRLAA